MISRKALSKRIKIRGGHLSHDAQSKNPVNNKWVINVYKAMYVAYKDQSGKTSDCGITITEIMIRTIRNRMLQLMSSTRRSNV